MEPQRFPSEPQDHYFSSTQQQEAWVEGAFWIAEEKRARLRADRTEEAFARLAFELCVRRTQDLEPS